MAETLFVGISQLATPPCGPQRGADMRDITVLKDAAILVQDELITWVGPRINAPNTKYICDLGGTAVVPGLIDPHTHAIWAGDRLSDFQARVEGIPYEAILQCGGGIHSTMKATSAATTQELVDLALPRLQALLRSGATTIEIKSGYGNDFEAEKRMLNAALMLKRTFPSTLSQTLLIHIPPLTGRQKYIQEVCKHLIPQVASLGIATAVDVFCEKTAFSVDETRTILTAAKDEGLQIKVHSDQFHALGATELACELTALSADHLEASGEVQIATLAKSNTVATILPGVTLHLGLPAAPARKLVDAGACVAIGTDLNPGSSPLFSTQLALALAVRLNGLTPAEALTASTVNAAAALNIKDRGALLAGQRADFLVLNSYDWRDLVYTLGANPVKNIFIGGQNIN